jgi:hypothetical protein
MTIVTVRSGKFAAPANPVSASSIANAVPNIVLFMGSSTLT